MKTSKYVMLTVAALGLSAASIGCSSSSSCADGGVCAAGGAGGSATGAGGGGGSGTAPFALSSGPYCYDILTIAPGFTDGCDIGPDQAVATPAMPSAIPVTYYAVAGVTPDGVAVPAGTIEVGTSGSLGRGAINANTATLVRDNDTSLRAPNTACAWHQTDTSSLQLTATNAFTISVSEDESLFTGATTCAAALKTVPASGSCTSTWTWTLKIDGALTPPACGNDQ